MDYEFFRMLGMLVVGALFGFFGRGVWDKRKAKKQGKL